MKSLSKGAIIYTCNFNSEMTSLIRDCKSFFQLWFEPILCSLTQISTSVKRSCKHSLDEKYIVVPDVKDFFLNAALIFFFFFATGHRFCFQCAFSHSPIAGRQKRSWKQPFKPSSCAWVWAWSAESALKPTLETCRRRRTTATTSSRRVQVQTVANSNKSFKAVNYKLV